jgi:two-component system OmpR family sensor kinase
MGLSLKARLTLGFVAGITVVSLGVAAFVYVQVRSDLRHQVDLGLEARAQALIAARSSRAIVASSGHIADQDEAIAQLVSADDRVLASTQAVADRPLLPPTSLAAGRRYVDAHPPGLDQMRLLVVPTSAQGNAAYLIVGATMSDTAEALTRLAVLFAVALPAQLVVSSLIGWYLAGAALAPVRRMSSEAEAVNADSRAGVTVPNSDRSLALLGTTLNATFQRLGEAIERERRFVANASHELRTPLATLKAEVDSALWGSRSEHELREALASAKQEVEHLIAIAEGLLVIARGAEGALPIIRKPTSLRELLRERLVAFAPLADRRRVSMEVDVDDVVVSLDRTRTRQALDNLIDNGLRHTPPGGTVRISARANLDGAEFTVEDDGSGFTPAALESAFQPFNRGTDEGGAGLGLAMAHAIAVAHGGSAHAENRTHQGAKVSLRLSAAGIATESA